VTGNFTNAAQLTQNGSQLTGALSASGSSGSFTGVIAGSTFTGSMRLEINTPFGRCIGTANNLTGPVAQASITLTAPTMTLENCPGSASDIEVRLTR
jgi:hypothetical protein